MSQPEKKCHFCGTPLGHLVLFSDGSGRWKCFDDESCLTRMARKGG